MLKTKRCIRLWSLLLTAAMLLSLPLPIAAAETEKNAFVRLDDGSINTSLVNKQAVDAPKESAPDDQEMVRVSIFLEEKSVLDAGFQSDGIAENAVAAAYMEMLSAHQNAMVTQVENTLGEPLDVVWKLKVTANAISANVRYGQIAAIKKIPGVSDVCVERKYAPPEPEKTKPTTLQVSSNGSQTGAEQAWAMGYTGAGTTIAIIDTGLDVEHEAFDADAFVHSLARKAGNYTLMDTDYIQKNLSKLNISMRYGVKDAGELYINEKIPFAFNYAEKNLDVSHFSSPHGSHVAGIAAANAFVERNGKFVSALEETKVQGVAPDAQILVMKVFGTSGGAYESDYMAAIDDAVFLGADVINLSLGSEIPTANREMFGRINYSIDDKDVIVTVSAGNSGAWSDHIENGVPYLYLGDTHMGTIGTPASYLGFLAVGSVESNGGTGDPAASQMSSFSGWSTIGKPDITAPGGNIYSVVGQVEGVIEGHNHYDYMSGTSMAAPQVAGMAALLRQYIEESGLTEKTGKNGRYLTHSLLTSTALPLREQQTGKYNSIWQQGNGLANVGAAMTAKSYIEIDQNYIDALDGYARASLDEISKGKYKFTFTIHNLTDSTQAYLLSADLFTQGILTIDGEKYMDKRTAMLDADPQWIVNGVPLYSEKFMDYNGDGTVNELDGVAILEYNVGIRESLSGSGASTTYDAYRFFTMEKTTGVTLEAGEKVTIEARIWLTEEEMAYLDANYDRVDLQGFVFAKEITDGETVPTNHSFKVNGFYGESTIPSGIDEGSYLDELAGNETRKPYLYETNYLNGRVNGILIQYAADPEHLYFFGGNPAVEDPVYMPERNAINNQNGDNIYGFAAAVLLQGYSASGKYQTKDMPYPHYGGCNESITGAYYSTTEGQWKNAYQVFGGSGFGSFVAVAENTEVLFTFGLFSSATDFRDSLEVSLVVDNTAPQMNGWELSEDGKTMLITATDNQYVAAVALLDQKGRDLWTYTGSDPEAEAGQTRTYSLDVSDVGGEEFIVQLIDYAGNTSNYRITVSLGEVVDVVDEVVLSDTFLALFRGDQYLLEAFVYPLNASNREVTWVTSNAAVVTVDDNGLLTAKGPGTAEITATSVLDPTVQETCQVNVTAVEVTINGVLQKTDGSTVMYQWDLATEDTWTQGKSLKVAPVSAAYDSQRNDIYMMGREDFTMYRINGSDGSVRQSQANAIGVPFWDMAYSAYKSGYSTPKIHGIFSDASGAYFFPYQNPLALDGYAFPVRSVHVSAIASAGHQKIEYDGTTYDTEQVLILTPDGILFSYWVYQANGSYGAFVSSAKTGYTDSFPVAETSMVVTDGGEILVATYDDGRCVLRRLVYDSQQQAYYVQHLADFGEDVRFATITKTETHSKNNHSVATAQPTAQEYARKLTAEELTVAEKTNEIVDINREVKTGAHLQANGDNTYTLTIYAKKGYNLELQDVTNGRISVSFNSQLLKLKDVSVRGKYKAINDLAANRVIFAYVEPNIIPAGDILAVLTFERLSDAEASISIGYDETNEVRNRDHEYVKVPGNNALVKWASASTTLGGNIGLNFYVELDKALVNDKTTFMRFTFAGNTVDVPLASALVTETGGHVQYRFTCPVNAKNMTDTVTAQVMTAAGAVGDSKSLAVTTYCNYMIQNSKDAELVRLMKAMLNYGAAAQLLFNHNVDNLANAGLSEEDKQLPAVDASGYAASVTGSEEGIALASASLMLETETSIRIYFRLTGDKTIDAFTFYVDGKAVVPIQKGNEYYVEIADIAAQDLDAMHTVTVGGLTVSYSGLSYVNTVMNNQTVAGEKLVNTAKALFAYNKLAESYFN